MLVVKYLYNLDLSQELLPWKVSILQQMYASVCMYDMHDPNTRAHNPNIGSSVEYNYICSLKCENNVLHQ